LAGASVIGDQHFEIGKAFNNVKFITPIKCATGKRKSGQGVVTELKSNSAMPFMQPMHELKCGLGGQRHPSKHCKEDYEQLTALVWLVVGIANACLQIDHRLLLPFLASLASLHCLFPQCPFPKKLSLASQFYFGHTAQCSSFSKKIFPSFLFKTLSLPNFFTLFTFEASLKQRI